MSYTVKISEGYGFSCCERFFVYKCENATQSQRTHKSKRGHLGGTFCRTTDSRSSASRLAAYERFKRHFSGDADTIEKLEQIIDGIKQKDNHKIEFYGISIEKIMPWFFIRLRDKRSKPFDKRKVSKTYRFKPETVDILKSLKERSGQSETEILENLIADA